jgi:predicted AlkP superfamily pyrophosphatase or phosphodiesterase
MIFREVKSIKYEKKHILNMKKIIPLVILFILLFGCTQTQEKYTFLITIDGARPDLLQFAQTPTIDYLISNYNTEYSFNSQTVCPSTTPVAHASLFTGKELDEHWFSNPNDNLNSITIFEILEDNNFKTLLFDGKGGRIKGLEKRVSYFYGEKNYRMFDGDFYLMQDFVEIFNEKKPTFSFILLPNVDDTGHGSGHESENYLGAINTADRAIAHLVYYLKEKDLMKNSNIIILSDHGMTNFAHDTCLDSDLTIPIIKIGERFVKGERSSQSIKEISNEILNIYNLSFQNLN